MKNLYTKLFQAQQKIKAIEKDSTNPHFKSKYFDINSLIAEIKPVLNETKLLILQPLDVQDGKSGIMTIAIDPESGEEMKAFQPLPELNDPQKMGAAISYYRRYGLTSLLLLEGEDDDGNSVAPKPTSKPTDTTTPTKSTGTKTCIKCGKEHTGPYPKCIDCWKAENPS